MTAPSSLTAGQLRQLADVADEAAKTSMWRQPLQIFADRCREAAAPLPTAPKVGKTPGMDALDRIGLTPATPTKDDAQGEAQSKCDHAGHIQYWGAGDGKLRCRNCESLIPDATPAGAVVAARSGVTAGETATPSASQGKGAAWDLESAAVLCDAADHGLLAQRIRWIAHDIGGKRVEGEAAIRLHGLSDTQLTHLNGCLGFPVSLMRLSEGLNLYASETARPTPTPAAQAGTWGGVSIERDILQKLIELARGHGYDMMCDTAAERLDAARTPAEGGGA